MVQKQKDPSPVAQVVFAPKTEAFCNPVEGIVTSSCGERENPLLEKTEFHNGLDIAVAEGTKVLAVKSGVVTKIRQSDTYGLVLEYETEDGFQVQYAHLQKTLVKEGEKIQQGQAVAKSGNSGLSTGPHLHYSLWKDGVLLDPMDYVDLPHTADVSAEYAARGEDLD